MNNLSSIACFYITQVNVFKFCDTRLLPTTPYPRPHGLANHCMLYIQIVMNSEKAAKLGHDQVTRLQADRILLSLA